MNHSPRIRMKILAYSKIFKAIGIIDEQVYNQMKNSFNSKRQDFLKDE